MAESIFNLKGKVTLVTGGNSGIGLGFARGVARQGGDVVIWARSAEKNAAAKAELEALGARVAARQVDASDEAQILAGYEALIAEFGRVDCVFSNAGMVTAPGSILDLSTEDYHKLLNLNLHGAYYVLREGARHMKRRAEAGEPGGSLVACGSLSMFMGLPGMPHYSGAKGALGAMIRGMAVEFGPYGIRANVIAPGLIAVAEGQEQSEHFRRSAEMTPAGRVGRPADFEGIAAYLASDASAFHTGDTIVIDGGYLVRPF